MFELIYKYNAKSLKKVKIKKFFLKSKKMP